MKQIILNDELTTYYIELDGRLMNKKTGNYYTGTIRQGYLIYDMRWNNKKYSKSAHRLVAEYFLENPNNYEYVHHKDQDRLNNHVSNLEWSSASNNNLSINKKPFIKNHSDNNKYDENTEQWKGLIDTNYLISNQGRVLNTITNRIIQGKITDSGYREYCLTINCKKKNYSAHRLVYTTFNPNEVVNIINHIDGNKLNNRLENLENTTSQDNNIKAIYDTKTKVYQAVGQYNDTNLLINTYITCAQAAREMGCTSQSINAAIHKNYRSCGFYWKYIEN